MAKPNSTEPGKTAQRVRDEAARLFWRNGYGATSTRELSEAIEIQKASLYHHIGSKELLLYDLCVDSIRNMLEGVTAALVGVEDPATRVRTLARVHLDYLLADRDKHATMLSETRSLSEEHREPVLELQARYEKLVRGVLAQARGAGVLRDDLPLGVLTLALFDLLSWSIFWWDPEAGVAPSAIADAFIEIFMEGALARSA